MTITKKYRLRNMKVSRVDLVDKGANEDAHILLAKALHDPEEDKKRDVKEKASGSQGKVQVKDEVASRIREFLADGEKAPGKQSAGATDTPFQPTPVNPREKGSRIGEDGSGSRIIRLDPAMFEVVSASGNMMEWAIDPAELPDGIEEAMMVMVQSGETVMFQWMIDPLAGPPVEGSAKTAAEAFVAMRGALTNQSAIDPTEPLGGLSGEVPLPGAQPGAQPGQRPGAQPRPGVPTKPAPSGNGAVPPPAGGAQKPNFGRDAKKKPGIAKALHAAIAENTHGKKKKRRGKRKPFDEDDDNSVTKAADTISFTGSPNTTHSYTVTNVSAKTAEDRVTSALQLITKGLVEVDVLAENATSEDVRDILPDNLLAELHNELSA